MTLRQHCWCSGRIPADLYIEGIVGGGNFLEIFLTIRKVACHPHNARNAVMYFVFCLFQRIQLNKKPIEKQTVGYIYSTFIGRK